MATLKMKLLLAAAITVSLCGANLYAETSRGSSSNPQIVPSSLQINALLKRDRLERERDYAAAAIKSQADLIWYVGNLPASSPLKQLSDQGRARFLNSLTFGDHGLASFSYADLQAELTASQIYRVLSLFGVQRSTSLIKGALVSTPEDKAIMAVPDAIPTGDSVSPSLYADHNDYRCQSKGTCESAYTYICTSNC